MVSRGEEELIDISGMAVASGLGCDLGTLRRSLVDGRRALSVGHRFQEWIQAPLGELPWEQLGVKCGDPRDTDRMMLEGCTALMSQLAAETGLFQRVKGERIGLFVGTTTSGIHGFFCGMEQHRLSGSPFRQLLRSDMQQASIMHNLIERFPLKGPAWTLSSSCAASSHAIALASDSLRAHMVDAALVVGVDVLNLVTILGFEALQVLDHELCEPFRSERKGINLAEVIAILLLERKAPDAATRVIRSHGCVTEAFHMTQPAPDGRWMRAAMEGAMRAAGVAASDIAYLNPHGTGTEANDRCEAAAIEAIFSEDVALHPSKRYSGHTLGASGAFESIVSTLMLEALDSSVLGRHKASMLPIGEPAPRSRRAGARRVALSNSFGFGGANVSLIIENMP